MRSAARTWRTILSRIHGPDDSLPREARTTDSRKLIEFGRSIHCLGWLDHLRKTHDELTELPEPTLLAAKKQRSRTRVLNRSLRDLVETIETRANGRSLYFLKGGAFLKTESYPPGVRRMGDLDLLIRRRDLPYWDRCFRELGFEPSPSDRTVDPDSRPKSRRNFSYYGSIRGKDTALDVHWHLLDSAAHRAAGLWDFAIEPLRSAGECAILRPEHRLIYGALHAFKHRYAYWKSLIDLSVLRRNNDFDTELFDRESRRLRARRILHLTGTVHEQCLGADLDIPWSDSPDPPASWRNLEKRVAHRAAERKTGLLDIHAPSLRLLNSWSDRARYLTAFLLPPLESFPEFSPRRNPIVETLRLYGHHYLAILRELTNSLVRSIPGTHA